MDRREQINNILNEVFKPSSNAESPEVASNSRPAATETNSPFRVEQQPLQTSSEVEAYVRRLIEQEKLEKIKKHREDWLVDTAREEFETYLRLKHGFASIPEHYTPQEFIDFIEGKGGEPVKDGEKKGLFWNIGGEEMALTSGVLNNIYEASGQYGGVNALWERLKAGSESAVSEAAEAKKAGEQEIIEAIRSYKEQRKASLEEGDTERRELQQMIQQMKTALDSLSQRLDALLAGRVDPSAEAGAGIVEPPASLDPAEPGQPAAEPPSAGPEEGEPSLNRDEDYVVAILDSDIQTLQARGDVEDLVQQKINERDLIQGGVRNIRDPGVCADLIKHLQGRGEALSRDARAASGDKASTLLARLEALNRLVKKLEQRQKALEGETSEQIAPDSVEPQDSQLADKQIDLLDIIGGAEAELKGKTRGNREYQAVNGFLTKLKEAVLLLSGDASLNKVITILGELESLYNQYGQAGAWQGLFGNLGREIWHKMGDDLKQKAPQLADFIEEKFIAQEKQ